MVTVVAGLWLVLHIIGTSVLFGVNLAEFVVFCERELPLAVVFLCSLLFC